MLTVYLLDDEQPALDRLARMLEATKRVVILGASVDPVQALGELARMRPDALFGISTSPRRWIESHQP